MSLFSCCLNGQCLSDMLISDAFQCEDTLSSDVGGEVCCTMQVASYNVWRHRCILRTPKIVSTRYSNCRDCTLWWTSLTRTIEQIALDLVIENDDAFYGIKKRLIRNLISHHFSVCYNHCSTMLDVDP